MLKDDTICALATPPGVGGLAVIRLSGGDAIAIADRHFSGKLPLEKAKSHTLHYGNFSIDGEVADTVIASLFKSPHSYTGEDVVEISCHGGIALAQDIVDALLSSGARHAEPGEFTKRAFLNRKLDLTQAEAVADLIHSVSTKGTRTAARQLLGGFTHHLATIRKDITRACGLLELELDFSEEDIEFVGREELARLLKEAREYCMELEGSFRSSEIARHGYRIGIAGFPNAGKSSLLNALLGRQRALVSEQAGTTRDYIEESLVYKGIMLTFFDTAGLRDTSHDSIELEGIRLAEELLEQCNCILILNDISQGKHYSDTLFSRLRERYQGTPMLLVHNKIDLIGGEYINSDKVLHISAQEKKGSRELVEVLYQLAIKDTEKLSEALINARQAGLLREVATSLARAEESLAAGISNEFVAVDARAALRALGEITGEAWSEDALNAVFSEFCIGK